jgi:phosphatidylserine decarboxylase
VTRFALAPGVERYAGPLFLLAIPAAVLAPAAGVAFLLVGAFVLWFHRDPDRNAPPSGVVSPADGRVSVLREEGDRVRVGVFLNVTDVHVIRAPLGGTVEYLTHRPGAHRPAFSKESDRNERVEMRFGDHEVAMVAGWFARRIHPYAGVGDAVERGDRIGHVSFGSRADVLLPPSYDRVDVLVSEGDRVRGGETVVAYRA